MATQRTAEGVCFDQQGQLDKIQGGLMHDETRVLPLLGITSP